MRFCYLFLLLAIGCKVAQPTSTTPAVEQALPVTDTTITEKEIIPIYVTQKGDTLHTLDSTVQVELTRVTYDTLTLSAVGDIMMGTNFPKSYYLPTDSGNQLWEQVRSTLTSTDLTFGNLEGVILTTGGEQKECKNPKACYLFRTPDHLSFQFVKSGFDLLSLANNHANDFGATGRSNTQKVLDSLGISHAGSMEHPYSIIRKKELTIGFVAFAPNKGTLLIHNEQRAIDIIQLLDSLTDMVIVSFHAGAEGSKNQHVTRKREFYYGEDRGNVYQFAHLLIDQGADLILGHGPHVVRGIEVYKERLIAYSLGNFLTYGRFNLQGPNAYAPILEVNLLPDGEFISGQIHSFIQDYKLGPIFDPRSRAGLKIKALTEIDFPENPISIDDSGRIIYLQH
ncbi:MAG: CapA family protein [Cyclobacteriaceae bacterium]